MEFELHPNLQKKIFLKDLALCTMLLEDNKHYPWIILVPKRAHKRHLIDLSPDDQTQLLCELNFVQKLLLEKFQPKQINVAAIGNKTPQLHIHVIARFENDPAWPGCVWDHKDKMPYSQKEKESIIKKLLFPSL